LDLLVKAYEDAIEMKKFNHDTRVLYIIESLRNGRIDEADRIYRILQDLDVVNIDQYSKCITEAGLANNFNKAVEVFWDLLQNDKLSIDVCMAFIKASMNTNHGEAADVIVNNIAYGVINYVGMTLDMLKTPSVNEAIMVNFKFMRIDG
jgi:lipopolysaccharide biosynthesis regulator YciM